MESNQEYYSSSSFIHGSPSFSRPSWRVWRMELDRIDVVSSSNSSWFNVQGF